MIIILCDSWKDACDAYDCFLVFLEINEPFAIRKEFHYCNCVETFDDLRYIFIDYRVAKIFRDMKPDVIDVHDFFEGIEYYYDDYV